MATEALDEDDFEYTGSQNEKGVIIQKLYKLKQTRAVSTGRTVLVCVLFCGVEGGRKHLLHVIMATNDVGVCRVRRSCDRVL